MLEALEHIEARASRREQNDVARFRRLKRKRDCIVHIGCAFARSELSQLARDRLCVFANQNQLCARSSAHQRSQRSIRSFLSSPAQNQNNLSRLRPANASSAFTVASTLVAFESL